MRTAHIARKTNETDITLTICLDGRGVSAIQSGVGFLDHMLTLLARHGRLDLELTCRGDTQVDDHHSVEDIGIALGDAVAQALGEQAVVILGDPRHYGRYGFWCGERWGISLENGQYLPGLQAVELAPGSLANAAGRFREGFAYAPDAAALDAFDALFLVKEKAITDFQQEFQVMCSLGHEVIPNGFMQ